jgi:hypothetical protein
VSLVWADSDIIVAAFIEAIHCLTTYRVSYGKVWRAKHHTLALLWGDWKEAYAKVPRLLHDIAHFNLGTGCYIDTCGQWMPNKTGRYYLVLKYAFWCFTQCVAGFTHWLHPYSYHHIIMKLIILRLNTANKPSPISEGVAEIRINNQPCKGINLTT